LSRAKRISGERKAQEEKDKPPESVERFVLPQSVKH